MKKFLIVFAVLLCIFLIACGELSREEELAKSGLSGSVSRMVREEIGVNIDGLSFTWSIQSTKGDKDYLAGSFTVNGKPATYTMTIDWYEENEYNPYDYRFDIEDFEWRYQ